MTTIFNQKKGGECAKLIRDIERNIPWHLFINGKDVGEWRNCREYPNGIEGDIGAETYQIDVITQ